MAQITRRDALKAAAASAGAILGAGPAWSQTRIRRSSEKLLGDRGGLLDQIPPQLLHLAGLRDIPALPLDIAEVLRSLPRLLQRVIEETPALNGLSNTYTIAGQEKIARQFLFGEVRRDELRIALEQLEADLQQNPTRVINRFYSDLLGEGPLPEPLPPDPLTVLALEAPDQWTISWTNFQQIHERSLPLLPRWAATMTDVAVAEEEFWPTMARYGAAVNLLVLQKLALNNLLEIKRKLGSAWTSEHNALVVKGLLYAIDMSIFETVPPNTVDTVERFTPATITLLQQDPATKLLKPILIRVAGQDGAGAQIFTPDTATDSAWLYAMLAAKTSMTVYGIWLGHVYQWHIVTAAMQMTMRNTLPRLHPVRELVSPQSDFLVGFDDILLLVWRQIAPSTSVATPFQFLQLINTYANRRPFAADNPKQALADLGLEEADFTVNLPWDQFPIVAYYLEIWDAVETYVTSVVDASYKWDRDVENDRDVQSWMDQSGKGSEGNVHGLPEVNSKAALAEVLSSLIYRVTVHGVSRLTNTANPAMAFVPNFPACLQSATIPPPTAEFDAATLLSYLPRTGTIGQMVLFYFTFAFSSPYIPFLPPRGLDDDLFFDGGLRSPKNQALIRLREKIQAFIAKYQQGTQNPQFQQWPLNIET